MELGFPVHFTGHLHDDLSLRAYYSAADLFVIPSRQDNLPNTGVEAHACGTPVVAFNTCGLPDIVDNRITGEGAFDALFASSLEWALEDPHRLTQLGVSAHACREALESFLLLLCIKMSIKMLFLPINHCLALLNVSWTLDLFISILPSSFVD